ncbi:MADS-box transcription factor 16-like [Papaver somniferum]|uniref:MADS-box transcription factor 16-like n=1 Tax=Papaver somniferum TaxID=3469 RepID=UPI000E7029BB|nr:MADS-box transcription factor 16-like [Papaver somniferum]
MGRRSGKLVIKYIENSTNRKVTYSKRKKGILKKARELNILCNAQVCLIMFSKSGKNTEYVSPSTTMKDFLDRYQRETNTSLWEAQYEALQEELRAQQEIGRRLKKEIRQRTGQDDLSEFSIEELGRFEKNLEESLEIVRDRKAKKVESCYPVPADNEGYHYLDFAQKQEQEFFYAVPSNNEGGQQADYGSASSSIRRLLTDGVCCDCQSSEITFQHLPQPSYTNLHKEAGGAYSYNQTFA